MPDYAHEFVSDGYVHSSISRCIDGAGPIHMQNPTGYAHIGSSSPSRPTTENAIECHVVI